MSEEPVKHTEPNVISHDNLVKQLSFKKSVARTEITGQAYWCRWCPNCKNLRESADVIVMNNYYACVKCRSQLCAAAFVASTDYEAHKMSHTA